MDRVSTIIIMAIILKELFPTASSTGMDIISLNKAKYFRGSLEMIKNQALANFQSQMEVYIVEILRMIYSTDMES